MVSLWYPLRIRGIGLRLRHQSTIHLCHDVGSRHEVAGCRMACGREL